MMYIAIELRNSAFFLYLFTQIGFDSRELVSNLAVYINSLKYHYTHIASTYIEREGV